MNGQVMRQSSPRARARLVAASLPIYALGVAVALFVWRQAHPIDPNRVLYHEDYSLSWFWAPWYGGLIALAALAILLASGATLRSVVRVAIVVVLVVGLIIGRGLTGDPGPFYLGWWLLWLLCVVSFLAYPAAYALAEESRAPEALTKAAPFVVAVVIVPIVLGPHYFSEWTPDSVASVIKTASIVALGGAFALLVGASALRLSPRTARIALWVVAVIQFAVFIRGLP